AGQVLALDRLRAHRRYFARLVAPRLELVKAQLAEVRVPEARTPPGGDVEPLVGGERLGPQLVHRLGTGALPVQGLVERGRLAAFRRGPFPAAGNWRLATGLRHRPPQAPRSGPPSRSGSSRSPRARAARPARARPR